MKIDFDVMKVAHYEDAHAVFEGENEMLLEEMDKERLSALVHFNDYESFAFCVLSDWIGNSAVIVYDSICGDLVGSYDSIEAFCNAVMEEIENDMEE